MNRNNGKQDFKDVKNRQDIGQYLQETFYCNYNHKAILATAEELSGGTSDPAELAKKMFKYVRDNIAFGVDLYKVKASDTLEKGFGACWNKSLLLVALLRCKKIPAEFGSIPVERTFIAPAIGKFYLLANDPFNHCFVRVNFNGKWVDLEPTLDQKTYDTFYRPINVSWNIDWDGSSNCRLYKESIMGPPTVHKDIDDTINNKVGNKELPKFLALLGNNWVNNKMWKYTGIEMN